MYRFVLPITTLAALASLAAPAGAAPTACDQSPAACTLVRFATSCSAVVVDGVVQTVESGRLEPIACRLQNAL